MWKAAMWLNLYGHEVVWRKLKKGVQIIFCVFFLFFEVMPLFWGYVRHPDNHIGWALLPFTSIYLDWRPKGFFSLVLFTWMGIQTGGFQTHAREMWTDAYPLEKPYQIPVNDRMLINTFSVAKASVSLAFQDAFQFFSQYQRGQIRHLHCTFVHFIGNYLVTIFSWLCRGFRGLAGNGRFGPKIVNFDGQKRHHRFDTKWTLCVQIAIISCPASNYFFIIKNGRAIFALGTWSHNQLHCTGSSYVHWHPLIEFFKEFSKTFHTLIRCLVILIIWVIESLLLHCELIITVIPQLIPNLSC